MYTRLLISTALCAAGTINSALLGGATGLAVGLASNLLATDLGTIWDRVGQRLAGNDTILNNGDLSKTVGMAIAAVIAKVARNPEYQDYQVPLQRLAKRATNRWTELIQSSEFAELSPAFEPIRDVNLVQFFASSPTDFHQLRVLTPEDWETLLQFLQQQDPEFMRDPSVMADLARVLHENFASALREVLKADFASDGRAFAALSLDLMGEIRSEIAAQRDEMLARLDGGVVTAENAGELQCLEDWIAAITNQLQTLQADQVQGWRELAEKITSGFGEVSSLLGSLGEQVATSETRIVAKVELLDDKLERVERVVLAIEQAQSQTQLPAAVVRVGNPFQGVSYWQGRIQEQQDLLSWFADPNVRLIGIEGIGGTGKSALAGKIFDELVGFPKRFWADLIDGADFSDLAQRVLVEFGASIPEKEADLADALVRCLQSGPFLLVLDNLESLLGLQGQWQSQGLEAFLRAWLEVGCHSKVLVTTRERPELRGVGVEWLSLAGLMPEEGAALLAALGVKGDLEQFAELVGGHPLLLKIVGILLKDEFPQNPSLQRLEDLGLGNLRQLLTDPKMKGQHHRRDVGMVLVLDASFERLTENQQLLLLNCCILRGSFNPAAALAVLPPGVLTDINAVQAALRQLVRRSLLAENEHPLLGWQFQFQPVVLEYLRYKAGDVSLTHQRAMSYYHTIAKPKSDWLTLEDITPELEIYYHAIQLQDYDAAYESVIHCDDFLGQESYYSVGIGLYQPLIAHWEQTGTANPLTLATSLNNLALLYKLLFLYSEAEPLFLRSLRIREQQLGADHLEVATSLNNLALLYRTQGRYSDAEPLFLRALQIMEQQLGADHLSVASSLNNLAELYESQGCYSEAEPLFLRALQIMEQQLGADHLSVAFSLNNLAVLYKSQGRYSEAESLFLRALQIMEQQLGANHFNVANSLYNLALLYESQGRYSEAEPLYLRSLRIWEQQPGADNPEMAESLDDVPLIYQLVGPYTETESLNNLALLYKSQGRYNEAEPLYLRSLRISEQQPGADDPEVSASLNNLAELYQAQGRYSEAEPLYLRSLQIREQQLGADHPEVASSLNNLAGLYYTQGRYSEAEPLLLRTLQISEQQLGADHPDVAASLNNLALLCYAQGRYSEMEPLYLRLLQIREQQLDADHSELATSLNKLAGLYYTQGRYNEAEPLYLRSLQLREQQLGADHPELATSLNKLAGLYYTQGRHNEAEPLLLRTLQISELQLDADHPNVETSLNNLALLYYEQRRYSEAKPLYLRLLKIAVTKLGVNHPTTTLYRNRLRTLQQSSPKPSLTWFNSLQSYAQQSRINFLICLIGGLFFFPVVLPCLLAFLLWQWARRQFKT